MASPPMRQVPEHDLQEPEYQISTTERSRLSHHVLKHDDAFALIDTHGDIGALGDSIGGLFFKDTRYLSRLELVTARSTPLLLNTTLDKPGLQQCCDLTNPDIYANDGLWLHKDVVHIYRTSHVRYDAFRQRLVITNFGLTDLEIGLTLIFDCDFSDIFEVRGMRRLRRGTTNRSKHSPQVVTFSYEGLDGAVRRTIVRVEPEPALLKETAAYYRLQLPPRASEKIFFTATADTGRKRPITSYSKSLRDAHRFLNRSQREITSVSSSNLELDLVLKRSLADLKMLMTETDDGPYPYAGLPWYSAVFGRDALITALQTLWLDPSIACGVLRRLARFQARGFDAASDAQPGKILHEMRSGEMAALGEIPFSLYYGSVDATPLFIILAGAYLDITADKAFLAEIWPSVRRALEWIDGPGDRDRDGFVEYARETEKGLSNQGWKDSHDAIFHSDGCLASGPIALVEVQGYVYAAKTAAAVMARMIGLESCAIELARQAASLRTNFERQFWCEDLGLYALALDGDKRPVRVRSSNAGHVLWSGIAHPDRAAHVIAQMLTPSFFSGWGIRTIATTEARYNPMSYHNGSIWPHDNAMIAAGFARYGAAPRIGPIFSSLLDAALRMEQRRLPELFCGFRRRSGRAPVLYPVACSPQAWSSGAIFQILSAMLGLKLDAAHRTITLASPFLPERMGAIHVRNLRVADGSVDFVLRQGGGGLALDSIRSRAGAKVILA